MPAINSIQPQQKAQSLTTYIDQLSSKGAGTNQSRAGTLGDKPVQTGVPTADVKSAHDLLSTVKNIALTQDETAFLFDSKVKGALSLVQGEEGAVIVKEINGELSVKEAGVLLGAVKRGLAEQAEKAEKTNPKPPIASPRSPAVPPRAPVVPPRGASLERGPQIAAGHVSLALSPKSEALDSSAVAQMFRSDSKPSESSNDDIAFWPSSREPGTFGVKLPGSTLLLGAKTEALALIKVGKAIQDHLGADVLISSKHPDKSVQSLAIWPSSKGGGFSIKLPGAGLYQNQSLEQAKTQFDAHRKTQSSQAQQTHSASNVLASPTEQRSDLSRLEAKLGMLQYRLTPERNDSRFLQQEGDNKLNRFNDIRSMEKTSVSGDLNANRMNISGKNVAIATQYPLAHQLESYLKMLAENRTPVVTVLTEKSQMDMPAKQMTDYFSKSGQFGSVTTKSAFKESVVLGQNIDGKPLLGNVFNLTISSPGVKSVVVPVLHVHNWKDKTAVDADTTMQIAAKVKELTTEKTAFYTSRNSSAVADENKLLPVIHCRAGVGRTGQVLAGLVMQDETNKASLESIVTDMRNARNGIMVQTPEQRSVLAEIAISQNRAVIN